MAAKSESVMHLVDGEDLTYNREQRSKILIMML